jgi:predicted alpha-1,6-mannanase (GH76 family)
MKSILINRHIRILSRIIFFLATFTTLSGTSCSKSGTGGKPQPPTAPPVNENKTFTATDALTAFNAFNSVYYSTTDRLYYGTSEKKGIGAIWTQAIYWDMVMNAYERTKDPSYYKMITDVYDGGYQRYDGYNWDNTTTWFIYDDMMWWVMSLTRAYKITNNPAYLNKAKAGFKRIWEGSYDPLKGGMFWDFKHSGKNACINYPTVIAAMRLYDVTNDDAYLDKAQSIYSWAHDNLFDITKGRVADHKIGNNNPGFEDYTYNQGTCIGAAVLLYQATNKQSYLDDAKLAAQYTKGVMSDASGILPAEGDYNEQGVLKAIFAQYLAELVKVYPQGDYAKWAIYNANTAWNNRDQTRNIMHRNYKVPCPTGIVQSYESSSAVAFMQLFAPAQ